MELLGAFLSLLLFFLAVVTGLPSRGSQTTRFVKANGTQFSLDGSKFTVVGANAYWLSLANLSEQDMEKVFSEISESGATTVRVWGHNEMPESQITPQTIYYQSWSGNKATINYGANGLRYFDRVVESAKRHNLRLIVVLMSYWNAADGKTGGVETYARQMLTTPVNHGGFFIDEGAKNVFKTYVKAVVGRYRDNPTVMSWELGHDMICMWVGGRKCPAGSLTAWTRELSSFIKSIDPNHLVASGDPGDYNKTDTDALEYSGWAGLDFEVNIVMDSIDYGTFSLSGIDPMRWIDDHVETATLAHKPLIFNKFGPEIYQEWLDKLVSAGVAGSFYWQFGSEDIRMNMPYWFYGDYVPRGSHTYRLLVDHAKAMKDRP
ncbi:CEL4b mannanase [Coprinopsis marcescibilis]|uniref:mannan endo-1,4-beta-mannosidase n=1 Tax=Coprinopsis marcescibilis TaxID=230819 RepID=A0A5C3KBB7_COPMA|nr:CEL4b mannanase [Coprinopsis marcescibilis]